jgi:starch synthase (maltosyl-transferring)
MTAIGGTARFVVDRIGRWKFTVEAWTDRFATWRSGLEKKVKAGQDVQLELSEGAQMARAASRSTRVATARASLLLTAKMLEDRRDTALEKRIQRAARRGSIRADAGASTGRPISRALTQS